MPTAATEDAASRRVIEKEQRAVGITIKNRDQALPPRGSISSDAPSEFFAVATSYITGKNSHSLIVHHKSKLTSSPVKNSETPWIAGVCGDFEVFVFAGVDGRAGGKLAN